MRCVNLTVALKASHHDNLDYSSGLMLQIFCFKRCDGLSLAACVVVGCMSPLLDSLAFDVAISRTSTLGLFALTGTSQASIFRESW
jgi:hypothetical protein